MIEKIKTNKTTLLIAFIILIIAFLSYFIMKEAGVIRMGGGDTVDREEGKGGEFIEEDYFLQMTEGSLERLIEIEVEIFRIREVLDGYLTEDSTETEIGLVERLMDHFQKIAANFYTIEEELREGLITEEEAEERLREIEKELIDFEITARKL